MSTRLQFVFTKPQKEKEGKNAETLAYLREGVERPFDAEDRVFCMRMLREIAGEIIAGEKSCLSA